MNEKPESTYIIEENLNDHNNKPPHNSYLYTYILGHLPERLLYTVNGN